MYSLDRNHSSPEVDDLLHESRLSFASAAGLKLTVEIEVPADIGEDQVQGESRKSEPPSETSA